jgi:hypothetical protein
MLRMLRRHNPPAEPQAIELRPLIGDTGESSNAHISVSMGEEEPLIFSTEAEMSQYIGLYPEAENDQATRLFQYAPGCSPNLLTSLLQKFDFNRFSMAARGLPRSSTQPTGIGNCRCKCEICIAGQFCGNSAAILHWNSRSPIGNMKDHRQIRRTN